MNPSPMRTLALTICGLILLPATFALVIIKADRHDEPRLPPPEKSALNQAKAPSGLATPDEDSTSDHDKLGAGPEPSTATQATSPRVRGDDEEILRELKGLQFRDPLLALQLADASERNFPESDTAAERSWFKTRALVELRRFDEAQVVATQMVQDFPDNPFAADVRRHLLSHPFGLPPRTH